MKELKTICRSYDMDHGWRMDIVDYPADHYAEAWIYQEKYGIKLFMFGMNYNIYTCKTFDVFVDMAITEYEDYKCAYNDEYEYDE